MVHDTSENPTVLRPPAPLFIPPEVLSHILTSLAHTLPDSPEGWRIRNATLATAALASKDCSAAAYHELYGDLRLEWVGWRRNAILAAFEANPNLHSLVRRVIAEFLSYTAWDERWYASSEVTALVEVAEQRWPTEGRRWGKYNAAHEKKLEFLRVGRLNAIRAIGEPAWLLEDPGGRGETANEIAERSGKDSDFAFWAWMGENSRVTCLDARQFEYPIPDPVNPNQQFEHVRVAGVVAGLLPHLHNVKTLTLGPTHDDPDVFSEVEMQRQRRAATAAEPPASGPLGCLEKLQSSFTGGIVDTLLDLFPLPLLVTLRLSTQDLNLDQLARSLPALPKLRSLYLEWHGNYPLVPPRLLHALSAAPLRHLSFDLWPTPALLSSLPRTLELLHIKIDTDLPNLNPSSFVFWSNDDQDIERREADTDEVVKRLAEVPGWKVGFAPALRAVRIETRVRGEGRQRMEAEVKEFEGFEGVLDEESWDAVLPPAWRMGD